MNNPIELLRASCPWSAEAVEGSSPRRAIREMRARIMLLLFHIAPPPNSPRLDKAWYIRGAVTRLSGSLLRQYFQKKFPDSPAPSERAVLDHFKALERVCAIVREPGQPKPYLAAPKEYDKRPRWSDTLHIVYTEKEAEWWAEVGILVLRAEPRCRRSAKTWNTWLRHWRELPERLSEPKPVSKPSLAAESPTALRGDWNPSAGVQAGIASALGDGDAAKALEALETSGCAVGGRLRLAMLKDAKRALGAIACLLKSAAAGKEIKSPGGWLYTVFNSGEELEEALAEVSVPGWGLSPLEAALEMVRSGEPKEWKLDVMNLALRGENTRWKQELRDWDDLERGLELIELSESMAQKLTYAMRKNEAYKRLRVGATSGGGTTPSPVYEVLCNDRETVRGRILWGILAICADEVLDELQPTIQRIKEIENGTK